MRIGHLATFEMNGGASNASAESAELHRCLASIHRISARSAHGVGRGAARELRQ